MKNYFRMRWTFGCFALLTMAFAARADVCSSVVGNVVTNCGFETGDFTGWTLSGNLEGGAPPNFYYGVDNTNPNSGSYAAYFGVQGGGGNAIGTLGPFLAVSQTLNLLPGEYYRVNFYVDQDAPRSPGYLNYIDFRFGGVTRASQINVPATNGYVPVSFVVATSGSAAQAASTVLQFDFQNDAGAFYFDDVSVGAIGAVPEPRSIALLLAGACCAAGLLLRRRMRSAPRYCTRKPGL